MSVDAASADLLVNGRFLTRPPTGVDRFASQLLAALGRRATAPRLDIVVPPGAPPRRLAGFAEAGMRPVGRRAGHAWEQVDLPLEARDRPLVNLCNTAPLARECQLVVIHDLATVANAANYGRAFRTWYRLMHGMVMKRARVVATVSRFSADQLCAHYGRHSRGVEVIPEGGEHILDQPAEPAILDRIGLTGRRYVLAVGSQSPNKNFAAVLSAVESLDDPELLVVAAGGSDARVFAGAGLAHAQLRTTGHVTDGELRALYEHAACFVFPSFYEGFGLPPLEAMCCDCPVIVSDRASLPEVCGDAALYCKAEDPATLGVALRRVLGSFALRDELRQAGQARRAVYGWDRAAAHFAEVLDANFA